MLPEYFLKTAGEADILKNKYVSNIIIDEGRRGKMESIYFKVVILLGR